MAAADPLGFGGDAPSSDDSDADGLLAAGYDAVEGLVATSSDEKDDAEVAAAWADKREAEGAMVARVLKRRRIIVAAAASDEDDDNTTSAKCHVCTTDLSVENTMNCDECDRDVCVYTCWRECRYCHTDVCLECARDQWLTECRYSMCSRDLHDSPVCPCRSAMCSICKDKFCNTLHGDIEPCTVCGYDACGSCYGKCVCHDDIACDECVL